MHIENRRSIAVAQVAGIHGVYHARTYIVTGNYIIRGKHTRTLSHEYTRTQAHATTYKHNA